MSGSPPVGLNRVSEILCDNPLVDLGLTGNWQYMLDSTLVCAHSQAIGAKWGSARRLWSIKWGLYEQLHAGCDNEIRPLRSFFYPAGNITEDRKAVLFFITKVNSYKKQYDC